MANVFFKRGHQADLDTLISNVPSEALELYLICRMLHLEEIKTTEEN